MRKWLEKRGDLWTNDVLLFFGIHVLFFNLEEMQALVVTNIYHHVTAAWFVRKWLEKGGDLWTIDVLPFFGIQLFLKGDKMQISYHCKLWCFNICIDFSVSLKRYRDYYCALCTNLAQQKLTQTPIFFRISIFSAVLALAFDNPSFCLTDLSAMYCGKNLKGTT